MWFLITQLDASELHQTSAQLTTQSLAGTTGSSRPAPQPFSERQKARCSTSHGTDEPEELTHWREREVLFMPSGIFQVQQEVTKLMRVVLVEWLLEVAQEFQFGPETLQLAINYMDRYLCKKSVTKLNFQLLGITCLWVAAKFDEVVCPCIQDMADMAAGVYSQSDLKKQERDLLGVLGFEVSCPTPYRFLHAYIRSTKIAPTGPTALFAEALVELALVEPGCAEMRPSYVASAALCAALSATKLHALLPTVILMSKWKDHAALSALAQGLYCAFTALCQPGVRRSPIVSRYLGRQAALARPSHTLTQVSPNDNQQAPSHARSQASGGPRAGVAPRPVALGSCAAAASSGTAAGGPRGAPFC